MCVCVCVLRMLCTNTAVYLNAKVGNKVTDPPPFPVSWIRHWHYIDSLYMHNVNNNIYYTS